MEPTAAQFGHLFSWRSSMDLSHAAAYRYNHNMMEYYTCESELRLKREPRLFSVVHSLRCLNLINQQTSCEPKAQTSLPHLVL